MCPSKEVLPVCVGRTEVPEWDIVVAPAGDIYKRLTRRVAEAIPC